MTLSDSDLAPQQAEVCQMPMMPDLFRCWALCGEGLLNILPLPEASVEVWRTPLPVIVTIRENKDYIRVLFYSYYTTITGWGVLLQ